MSSLNNIKPNKKRIKKSKRFGRGNSSGKGAYCGKGIKGQRARSGVSRLKLKRLGLRSMMLQTPKNRGFRSLKPKNQIVKIDEINKNFKDGDKITLKMLFIKGLIKNTKEHVKILGKEKLEVKVSFDSNIKTSESVKQIKK